MLAVDLMVSEKKIFEGSLAIIAQYKHMANLDPRDLIGRIYVEDHYT